MKPVRIVEITNVDGIIEYQIQQRHFLFRWQWVPAWVNSDLGAMCYDTFSTLKEAKKNLCYFDGSKPRYKVIHTGRQSGKYNK